MTLTLKRPASEAQFMCDSCSEVITNPICPNCLSLELDAWLTPYPVLHRELSKKVHELLFIVDKTPNPTKCITCKDNTAVICPYCFTEKVLLELKKLHANKPILEEFFVFFNFDFDHTGYYKEAEELGVF